jgi:hypothetical protein
MVHPVHSLAGSGGARDPVAVLVLDAAVGQRALRRGARERCGEGRDAQGALARRRHAYVALTGVAHVRARANALPASPRGVLSDVTDLDLTLIICPSCHCHVMTFRRMPAP